MSNLQGGNALASAMPLLWNRSRMEAARASEGTLNPGWGSAEAQWLGHRPQQGLKEDWDSARWQRDS